MDSEITVVIPTRNRANLLDEAVRSVLASSLVASPQRVVVVDDGSIDHTPEVAARHGVRYTKAQAGSAAGARNAGLALVETGLVAFLDDDDVWLPGNMVPQRDALIANPSAAFAYGRFQLTDHALVPFGRPVPDAATLPSGRLVDFLYMHNIQLGTVLLRTGHVREIGAFDVSEPFSEDQDLLLRLANRHKAVGVEFVGSLFRQRAPSERESAHRLAGLRARGVQQRRYRRHGIRPSLKVRVRARWKFGGFGCWLLCQDAKFALQDGRRGDAVRYLAEALKLSPPHALLRNRAFWTTAFESLRGRRSAPLPG